MERMLEKDIGSAARLGVGAGFGGEWVASAFIMEGSDVPFVEEEGAVAAACLGPGEVMCESRLGGLWEPVGRFGCECERGLVGRRLLKDEVLARGDG